MILSDADGLLMVYRILVAECPCLVCIPTTTTNTILSLIHMAFTTNTRNLLLLVS